MLLDVGDANLGSSGNDRTLSSAEPDWYEDGNKAMSLLPGEADEED